jgi:putative ABC transport system permease protein
MLRNYLAAALRNLSRNRLYAGVTIFGLAVGFASALLIGLYLRHEFTYDQFVKGHDRVFLMNEIYKAPNKPAFDLDFSSAPLAKDLKLDFPQIEYAARLDSAGFPPVVRHGQVKGSERLFAWADPDFFKVMPMPTVAGDPGTALDAPDGLVLTRGMARKYFGQDAPLGAELDVDGHPMRVAAVIEDLPSNTHLAMEFFASTNASFSAMRQLDRAGYGSNSNATYIRLKPSASAAQMDAALPAFVSRRIMPFLIAQNPDQPPGDYRMRLKPLTAIHLEPADGGDYKPGADVKVLIGIGVIGVLIVVVAAINFVTLMTARAARRAVEVGVRKALGAERRDLIAQFMGEALIYVLVALVMAVAVAELLLPAVNAAVQRKMTFAYLSDPQLLGVMLGVALVTGLAAGLYPALVLSAFRPAAVLKGGPIAGSGGGAVRQGLVVAQFAVLIALVIATITIARQTLFSLGDATHMNKDGVMMLFAQVCTDELRDQVLAVPGVRGAACASTGAIDMGHSNDMSEANGRKVILQYSGVDFGFFELYGVKPVAGRLFRKDRPADDGGHMQDVAPTVILNEAAARELGFKSPQGAVGQLMTWHFDPGYSMDNLGRPTPPARASEIVGVVPDISLGSVKQKVPASFYYIAPKNSMMNSLALNIKIDPAHTAETLKGIDKVWARVSGGQPVQKYFVDQFLLIKDYLDNVIQGGFIAVCSLIAVSIACLGLFALSAYTAERRTKEIGIRKAMGASSADILRLLLWQFTQPVLWANLLALPAAWFVMNRWLEGFAYHVTLAPWTFVAAAGVAVLIAWGTVFVHALRVARARPVGALRYE